MEGLSVLLLIALVILILNQNSRLSENFKKLENELKLLRRQLMEFTTVKQEEKTTPVPPPVMETPKPATAPVQEIITPPPTPPEKLTEKPAPAESLYRPQQNNRIDTPKAIAPRLLKPSFFERNPDMEKFIGENLVSKIGIAVLVLAIGFFVKYAIDQNWIGPAGRVSIGILCGGILIAVAHRLRNSYKSFSSVLAGGGLAVFYFTITLAFHQFHLFNQATSFIIMIVVTIFAVALALLYNKQELAIIALIGGFMAPFLVSTGEGNYKTLFIYLIILNTGLLVIAYNKAWRLLNLLSFIFTVLIFGIWLINPENPFPAETYRNALIFAIIFYLLFFIINIAHNIREKKKFIASDFGILLANTGLFFGAGIFCLYKMNATELRGLFSASLGIFNLAASYHLFRKQKVDTNILYLLIGITLTFISITAPVQLKGNHITIFWASEAVLLYWLSIRSNISIIKVGSFLVWLLMLGSLVIDWVQVYDSYPAQELPVVFNKGFITTFFTAIATYLFFILRSKELISQNPGSKSMLAGKTTFRIGAILLLFAAGALEINHQFSFHFPETEFNVMYLLLYTVAFISILTLISQNVKALLLNWRVVAVIFAATITIYLLAIAKAFNIQEEILVSQKNNALFAGHWITALLTILLFLRLISLIRKNSDSFKQGVGFITWLICGAIVVFLSSELLLLGNAMFYSPANSMENISRVYIKTVLPILWGLCSFAFMWLGMRHKMKTLRIISLTLFTLTLLKLFIFDIRNIPAGGKIAAFFCLGILLLVVSFMYQRLKKIIIDNEEKVD